MSNHKCRSSLHPNVEYDEILALNLQEAIYQDEPTIFEHQSGKKFNQMDHTSQASKTNEGSVDEEYPDRRRLLDRLREEGITEYIVEGDGNCQFRALAHQIYGKPELHHSLRQAIVEQIQSHPDLYEGHVTSPEYVQRMAKSGQWGDNLTLQACADLYGSKIILITSFEGRRNIEIHPRELKTTKVIRLSFLAGLHYNSINRIGGGDTKKCCSVM